MPTFVDFAGMNTLVSSSIDGNTLSSGRNTELQEISVGEELVGINLHRNGPYGYSTWKQLRASENPITRHHKKNSTMTFVIQPGPVRNILSDAELRVRDRYSVLYNFTEPAIAQKAYPLIWNVGRHFKDENGFVDLENPHRFSIISSYANQGIGFANNKVDELHRFNPDEEKTEYREIYKLYAEGGLNDQKSPLTHWEFLRYRETVFPHMKNQFQNENLERPNFTSFFRHNRANRTGEEIPTSSFGYAPKDPYKGTFQSIWPMDEEDHFIARTYVAGGGRTEMESSIFWGAEDNAITGRIRAGRPRRGEGALMNTLNQFSDEFFTNLDDDDPAQVFNAAENYDERLGPGPLYMRRISLKNTASIANPSGMIIPQTGAAPSQNALFQGGALWETGRTREIKDADGNYISAPKNPSHDTYEHYIEDARRRYKNFSVIPEFRMSTQIEDYLTNNKAIELDMFDLTGGLESAKDSSQPQFYEVYSNSDFLRQFELINEEHRDFTNGKVLSLRCKALKKFLPYEGFYPCQRTVTLAERFYNSFSSSITLFNAKGVQIPTFNFGRQFVMRPLFAPGVLFNTIKSGVAVDYPVITSSVAHSSIRKEFNNTEEYLTFKEFDVRIPFEALVEPKSHLANITIQSNEPHPSGTLSASAIWDGTGDELYSKMANNFLAEVPEFFLPNGNFSSLVSKKQGDGIVLESGVVYGMRVAMNKTYNNPRIAVYHENFEEQAYLPPQDIIFTGSAEFRENFTMYSRPSAFGPPTLGENNLTSGEWFVFDNDHNKAIAGPTSFRENHSRDSRHGFNFPFTPPYYHGEAWCDIWITGSGEVLTIEQIQSRVTASFTRFDISHITSSAGASAAAPNTLGPQAYDRIDANAVQLDASLNIFGAGKLSENNENRLVVDSGLDQDSRWVIQTKFETPMFNFNHISEDAGNLTIPAYGVKSVPRGMWHQYGRIPEEEEGVFIGVRPIDENWQRRAMRLKDGVLMSDLSEALGFSNVSTKLGRLRSQKIIHEAVVAVPFFEEEGRKKFFSLDPNMVEAFKRGGEDRVALTNGEPQKQIGRSVLDQLYKMQKYIFPPSFDFLNNTTDEVKPIAMYIFEFSHTLSQQDLADIWQNLPPDINLTMEESEVAITHPLLKKELLGEADDVNGNILIDMPNKLRWMVFKVKQRAASNYFKKTVLRNPIINSDADSENVAQDEFGNTSHIQYNWPYDFFSLVELVKIDAEIEFGTFREEDIANYTNSIPPYESKTADMDKIEYIVGGIEDGILVDNGGDEFDDTGETNQTGEPSDTGPEGILDIPSDIPEDEGQVYRILKIRFVQKATADPLGLYEGASYDAEGNLDSQGAIANAITTLQDRATAAVVSEGNQLPDDGNVNISTGRMNSYTGSRFYSWSRNWYNTDPIFQVKRAEALASFEGAQEAVDASNYKALIRRAKKFTGKRFFLERDKAFVGKKKARKRAINQANNKFKNNRLFNAGVQIAIKNEALRLESLSNSMLARERPNYF